MSLYEPKKSNNQLLIGSLYMSVLRIKMIPPLHDMSYYAGLDREVYIHSYMPPILKVLDDKQLIYLPPIFLSSLLYVIGLPVSVLYTNSLSCLYPSCNPYSYLPPALLHLLTDMLYYHEPR